MNQAQRTAFLSYSHLDKANVDRLKTDFDSLGWNAWCDSELTGGQRWWDGVLQQIRSCDLFVVALSDSSFKSEACSRELSYATALGKPVLPILVGAPVEDALLPPVLSETQRVDGRVGDARMALALGRALMQVAAPPPLPDPLPEAPPVPVSYMTDLRQRLVAEHLDSDAQWRLLGELQEKLSQEENAAPALVLLTEFANRPDLMQSVAHSAQRAIAAATKPTEAVPQPFFPPPPPPEDPPGDTSPPIPPRRHKRSRWLLAGLALVVVAGLVVAAIVVFSGDEESDAGAFCDRARSLDSLTDAAYLATFQPEQDPAELQKRYDDASTEMKKVVARAPRELLAATQSVQQTFEATAAMMRQHNWQIADAGPELLTLVSSADANAQDAKFSDYLTKNCAVDWNSPGFTDVPTAARALGVQFAAFLFGVPMTKSEDDCYERTILDDIDGARLLLLFGAPNALPTSPETISLLVAVQECVNAETLATGFGQIFASLPGVTEEQSTCLAGGILRDIGMQAWAEVSVSTPASQAMIDQLGVISTDCGVDPRVVQPIVGG
jgi:hypothetical protein